MANYERITISISIDKNLKQKLDKVKNAPHWKGDRSAVVEAALKEYLKEDNDGW